MLNLQDYPWIFPPPGFIPLEANNTVAVAAGSTRLVVETIKIDVGFDGWIVQAGIELSSYASASYQLRESGVAVRNYENIRVPLGAPNTPAILYIHLKPNQPFTLAVTNSGAGPVAARWRFYGWYYPRQGVAL